MKNFFLPGVFLLCLSIPVFGMEPPPPGQLAVYGRDGTLAQRAAFAEKIGNNKFSPAAVARLKNQLRVRSLMQRGLSRAQAISMAPPPAWGGMPTSGNPRMFVLLIDFNDYAHANSSDTINTRIFGAGTGGYPYESLTNYYSRSSYGQLTIQGATLGWYHAGVTRAAIPQTYAGREALIEQAISYFGSHGQDFAPFDNNGDGKLDYFAVIWTGPDNGWSNFWWGYDTSFNDQVYTINGKTLGNYSWMWESSPPGGAYTPLVLIHETGHALGLPDYYDYDVSAGPGGGVGGMDMMDGNYGDHNCFSKFMLDWIAPVNSDSGNLAGTLRPSDAYPDAVKMMPDASSGEIFNEYFMVQSRRKTGNDQGLPGSGLVIWHVDAHLDASGQTFLFDNSYTAHKILRLMEADGLESIAAGYAADAGDIYGPGNVLSPVSVPDSSNYAGAYTGITVSNIAGTTDSRTFDYFVMNGKKLVVPTDNVFRPLKGGKCKLDVTALRAGNVTIKAYTVNGTFVKTVFDGAAPAGVTTYSWAGDNANGATVASGLYLLHVAGPGLNSTEKVVVIK